MRVYDWFLTIAASLNDAKPNAAFRRYALKDLIAYFNDAMCLIAKHRPDLFTEMKNVQLTCGSLQDMRDCCGNIYGVIAQTDVHGNILKELTDNKKTETKIRSKWNKPSCLSVGRTNPATGASLEYVIDTVSIDTRLNGRFSVFPPVPPAIDAYVLVKCDQAPCRLTEAAVLADTVHDFPVDCGYLAIARFYVLAWALSGDRHSEVSTAESTRAFKVFFDWLGVVEAQEAKYERGAA